MTSFRQGDIIMLDFQPQASGEQSGRRPAIVVSNDFFNGLSNMAIVCPITSTTSNFPLNVLLDEQTMTQGSILCQHVKSLDLKIRHASYIERLPEELFKEVKEIIVSQL